jgi:hypothetical protein
LEFLRPKNRKARVLGFDQNVALEVSRAIAGMKPPYVYSNNTLACYTESCHALPCITEPRHATLKARLDLVISWL